MIVKKWLVVFRMDFFFSVGISLHTIFQITDKWYSLQSLRDYYQQGVRVYTLVIRIQHPIVPKVYYISGPLSAKT